MLAGTRTERTIVASSITATANPKPICWNITSLPAGKAGEDGDHDQRRAGDDLRGRLQADRHRLPVVVGLAS